MITIVNILWSSFADDPPWYPSSTLNTVVYYTSRPTPSFPSWWHQKYNTWGTGNDMGMLKFSKSYALVVSFLFPLLLFLWINPDCATREYTSIHTRTYFRFGNANDDYYCVCRSLMCVCMLGGGVEFAKLLFSSLSYWNA